jgi:phage tail sheath protein FI
MPQYLSPGVYVEEVDKGAKPIEGVGTAVAAFIGFAEKGPINQPVFVANWNQFLSTFGGFLPEGFLALSVYGYFNNGGGSCYVVRLPMGDEKDTSDAPQLLLKARSEDAPSSLKLLPKGEAEGITVEIIDGPEGTFNMKVSRGGEEETFEGLSLGKAKGARNVADVVTKESNILKVEILDAPGSLMERVPAVGKYSLEGAPTTTALVLKKAEPDLFVGDVAERRGMGNFHVLDDVTMVVMPDVMAAYQKGVLDKKGVKAIQQAMIDHCENMKDRVAILDAPPGLTPQEVKVWRQEEAGFDSKYAAMYYPWIEVPDPSGNGNMIHIPPSGHLAGIYARTDTERGVHKAPANEIVRGTVGLAYRITRSEQDSLNPIGVNCIRAFPGRGIRVWGARTLSSDASWRYVPVRRLFNFVEKSIELGTQWVVFEPNDVDLWERVKRDITAFLTRVWRDGALFGATPSEAFYVKCDEELNTPEIRDAGQMICEVGLAPVKPAEFVIFRISQFTGGAEVSE